MDEAITVLVDLGMKKLQEKEQAEKAERERIWAEIRAEWRALEASVREAFPEEIRQYVTLRQTQVEQPDERPGGILKVQPYLSIEGLAPIYVMAQRKRDPETKVLGPWQQTFNDDGFYYLTPHPEDDYDYGVIWNFRWGYELANDLALALAHAKIAFDRFEELRAARAARQTAVIAALEPAYEPVDQDGYPLVKELVKLIRDVVAETAG